MKMLNDTELANVAGGYDDDRTVVDTFVDWLAYLLKNGLPEE